MALTRSQFTDQQFGGMSPEAQQAILANTNEGQSNEIVGGAITNRDSRFRYTQPPVTPPPVPAPPLPSGTPPPSVPDPVRSYYEGLNITPPGATDEAAVRESVRQGMQAHIDAINAQYANLVGQEQQRGEERAGQTRAISARSGLLGSSFAQAHQERTGEFNKQAEKAIQDERAVMLSSIENEISQRAREEVAAKKAEAAGNAERYIAYLENAQEGARSNAISLAQAGVALDKLNPQVRAKLAQDSAYDPITFETIYNANLPKEEKVKFTFMQRSDGSIAKVGDDGSLQVFDDYKFPEEYSPEFMTNELTGETFVYDKNNAVDESGNLVLSPVGKFAPSFAEKQQAELRQRYASGGGGGTVTERLLVKQETAISKSRKDLSQERATSKDGYANPNTYRDLKASYISAGGSSADFFQAVPIEEFISPANRKGDLAQKGDTPLDPAVAAFLGL